jgi:hypothetical protein
VLQSLFSILGSFSSFFAHLLYASSPLSGPSISFRLFCAAMVALAIPAVEVSVRVVGDWARSHGPSDPSEKQEMIGLQHTTRLEDVSSVAALDVPAASAAARVNERTVNVRVAPIASGDTDPLLISHTPQPVASAPSPALTFHLFLRQLLSHRNFSLFCLIRLLQVFLCTFEKNHLSSFLDILLAEFLSTSTRGLLISMSFILPHLLLLVTSMYQTELGGVYAIIRKLFTAKILAAVAMLTALVWGTSGGMTGLSSSTILPYVLMVYLCGSRVFTECVCRLFPLVVSNLVDEDR